MCCCHCMHNNYPCEIDMYESSESQMFRTDKGRNVDRTAHVIGISFCTGFKFSSLVHEKWFRKPSKVVILLRKGTDFLGSERIHSWRNSSQQEVMWSILQTELFHICGCLLSPGSSQSCSTTFFMVVMLGEPAQV